MDLVERNVASRLLSKQPIDDEFAMLLGQTIHAVEAWRARSTCVARNHLWYIQDRASALIQMICDEVPVPEGAEDSEPLDGERWCEMGNHFADADEGVESSDGEAWACVDCFQDRNELLCECGQHDHPLHICRGSR